MTFEISQDDKSWLKDFALLNIWCMSVTFDTSHDPIGPLELEQAPLGDSLKHDATAVFSTVWDCGANGAPKNEVK